MAAWALKTQFPPTPIQLAPHPTMHRGLSSPHPTMHRGLSSPHSPFPTKVIYILIPLSQFHTMIHTRSHRTGAKAKCLLCSECHIRITLCYSVHRWHLNVRAQLPQWWVNLHFYEQQYICIGVGNKQAHLFHLNSAWQRALNAIQGSCIRAAPTWG